MPSGIETTELDGAVSAFLTIRNWVVDATILLNSFPTTAFLVINSKAMGVPVGEEEFRAAHNEFLKWHEERFRLIASV